MKNIDDYKLVVLTKSGWYATAINNKRRYIAFHSRPEESGFLTAPEFVKAFILKNGIDNVRFEYPFGSGVTALKVANAISYFVVSYLKDEAERTKGEE